MNKVLYITNIPSPYRVDFFNELGKSVDLTVLFEAKSARGITFNYDLERIRHFNAVFLCDGDMQKWKIDWKILLFLKRGEYDRVVVTNYGFLTEAVAILTLQRRKIPYEMEIDGGIIRRENPLLHALKTRLVLGAARYWSTGDQTDAFYRHFGIPDEKIKRYPFTSVSERDLVNRPLTAEEKLEIRKGLEIPYERMVLAVGQTIPRKGFDLLIRAASSFPDNTGVYIAGGEPPREWLGILDERSWKNIRFIPYLSKALLREYYRAADVFALPTREDVWGLVVNEAMAAALPVVTTNACGAGREMIQNGENGFLVPSESVEPLAKRIVQLLQDDILRERMSISALETARRYTIEEMARVHAEAFA